MGRVMHEWYVDFGQKIGARTPLRSDPFFDLCHAWQQAEGGTARHDPFDTTEPWPGATDYNSAGVKNYASREDGVDATVKTLLNGHYNDIVTALRRGESPYVVADLIGVSSWGTNGDTIKAILKEMGVPE
jgi:hypothetical protein